MTLVVELPVCHRSWLGGLDGRWRLAGLVALAVGTLLLRRSMPAGMAVVVACLLGLLGNVPARWLVPRLLAGLFMVALFGVWLPFFPETGTLDVDLGGLRLSSAGLEKYLVTMLKTGAVLGLLLIALVVAPIQETLRSLQALRVPSLLVNLILLTYRYLQVIADEFRRIRIALRVRGFKSRADGHTYRTIGHVSGTLLVRGHERSERVAHAMRCRGFVGQFPSHTDFRTKVQDWAFFLLLVIVSAAIVLCDRWG